MTASGLDHDDTVARDVVRNDRTGASAGQRVGRRRRLDAGSAARGGLILALLLPAGSSTAVTFPECPAGPRGAAGASSSEAVGEGAEGIAKEVIHSALHDVGGKVTGPIDGLVIDPLTTYLTSESPDAVDRTFWKVVEAMNGVAIPGYGILINGGRIAWGATSYAVEEMVVLGRRRQVEETVFGRQISEDPSIEHLLVLSNSHAVLRHENFFASTAARNAQGGAITPENIGARVRNEEDLRKVWEAYGRALKGGPMQLAPRETAEALQAGWPVLRDYWRFRRAGAVIDEFQRAFARRLREAARRNASQPAASAPEPDLSGDYVITEGANPAGSRVAQYPGSVKISKERDASRVHWQITASEAADGVGIQTGNTLGVGYRNEGDVGVAVYRICGGNLMGFWTHSRQGGRIGTETLQGPHNLSGTYRILGGARGDGQAYDGTVTIQPQGRHYRLSWKLGTGEQHSGVGIRRGDLLFAGWGEDGAGVAVYQQEGSSLSGQWTTTNSRSIGREFLVPRSQFKGR